MYTLDYFGSVANWDQNNVTENAMQHFIWCDVSETVMTYEENLNVEAQLLSSADPRSYTMDFQSLMHLDLSWKCQNNRK